MIRRSDNALSLRSEIGAHANAKISLAIFRRMGVMLGRRHSLPSIRGKEKGSETRDSGGGGSRRRKRRRRAGLLKSRGERETKRKNFDKLNAIRLGYFAPGGSKREEEKGFERGFGKRVFENGQTFLAPFLYLFSLLDLYVSLAR